MTTTSSTKKYIAILLLGFVIFELSLLLSLADSHIWLLLENANSSFRQLTQVFSELPVAFLLVLTGIVLALYHHTQNNKFKSNLGIVCMMIGLVYSILIFMKITNRFFTVIGIILFAAVFWLVITLLKNATSERMFQYYCIAFVVVVYLVSTVVIVNILSLLWGRISPIELLTMDDYSKFYIPHGINGNRSFPSVPAAITTTVFIATMFVPLAKRRPTKMLLYTIPIVWILTMALCLVSTGISFASDVLYGILFSIVIFYFSKRFTLILIAKSLE